MADIEGEQKTEEISTSTLEDFGSENDEENEDEVVDSKPVAIDISNYLPKKNSTASSTFSHSIANLVNRTDLQNCIHLQHEIYKRMNDSQRALQTFNTFSAKEFNKLAPEIERKTKMIQAMKKDLYSIFDRISELREVLGDRYPEYAVLLPEEMEEEEDDFPIPVSPTTPVVERMSFSDVTPDAPTERKQVPIDEATQNTSANLPSELSEAPKELPTEPSPQNPPEPEPTQSTAVETQPPQEPVELAEPSPAPVELVEPSPVTEPLMAETQPLPESPAESPVEPTEPSPKEATEPVQNTTEENHEKAELETESVVE